ncbi:MAG TPA: helix-turn-helix domain-containing protein [Ideonella sp.]|uniref:helix-turn-helix domain-containing protein n=1 Tax=Ideonella sp. TaxID=1929293 RepID=UPI002E32A178|nr:helix-turn-helix domain-containing protein [Ideonella sp.]HEX5688223.1 helix-turn-helix domain-containing protein [Ideonella sp.]
MRQTELRLSPEDRAAVQALRSKGVHRSREVNRAHMLACLDAGLPEAQILAVLGIGRTALWRTRAAYLQGGLELALFDVARPGRPRTPDAVTPATMAGTERARHSTAR